MQKSFSQAIKLMFSLINHTQLVYQNKLINFLKFKKVLLQSKRLSEKIITHQILFVTSTIDYLNLLTLLQVDIGKVKNLANHLIVIINI